MANNVYGVRRVVLTELNQDGSAAVEGKTITIDTPQEVSYSPNIKEGAETEQRGGGRGRKRWQLRYAGTPEHRRGSCCWPCMGACLRRIWRHGSRAGHWDLRSPR